MSRQTNKIIAKLTQIIPASVSNNGFEEDTVNEAEFSDESASVIDSTKLGLWLLCTLKHFVELARLQGKKGFNLNKPIDLLVKVNGKEAKVRFKFSLNVEKIMALAVHSPKLIAAAFRPAPGIGAMSGAKAMEYLTGDKPVVIAEATAKVSKKKELPVSATEEQPEKLSLADINLSDEDLKALQ